jgi:hypothetical protein
VASWPCVKLNPLISLFGVPPDLPSIALHQPILFSNRYASPGMAEGSQTGNLEGQLVGDLLRLIITPLNVTYYYYGRPRRRQTTRPAVLSKCSDFAISMLERRLCDLIGRVSLHLYWVRLWTKEGYCGFNRESATTLSPPFRRYSYQPNCLV